MKKEIKDDSYFVIRGYMVNELKLQKSELLVYAIVNSFTEKGKTYSGSLSYLASWINGSRTTANNVLKSLTKKGLLNKTEKFVNNVKFCEYTVNRTPKKKEEEECSKNDDGIPKIDTPDQKQNSGKKTDTGECNNFCDGISKNDTGSQKIEPGCIKNCTGGVSISDTGYAKNCTGGIPISEPNKELDTSSNNKFDKESEKESDNQENEDSISINKVNCSDSSIEEKVCEVLDEIDEKGHAFPYGFDLKHRVNSVEEVKKIATYFFQRHYAFFHEDVLPEITWFNLYETAEEYCVTDGILYKESIYKFDQYKKMIDLYFDRYVDHDGRSYKISNFMKKDFRERLYREIERQGDKPSGIKQYRTPPRNFPGCNNEDYGELPFE